MPGYDATGPWRRGPGTGWGRGQGWGAGFGGFGFRRGYGPFGYGPYSSGSVAAGSLTDDAAALRAAADSLKSELEAVQKRLQELEGRQ
jgi:Family of unknown function (DUF5320)